MSNATITAPRQDYPAPDQDLFSDISTSPETAKKAATLVRKLTGIGVTISPNEQGTGYILTPNGHKTRKDEACKLVYDAIAEHAPTPHNEIHIKPTGKYSFPIALSAQITEALATHEISPNTVLAYKIQTLIARSTGRGDIRVTPSEPDAGFIIQRRHQAAPGTGTSMDVTDTKLIRTRLMKLIEKMPEYSAEKFYVYTRPSEKGETFPIQVSHKTGQYLASLPTALEQGRGR